MIRLHAWLKWIAWLLVLCVLALMVLTARAVLLGEQELEQSDRAFHRGAVEDAVLHARRAAILYAPGAPHVERAYQRLFAVALGAEAAGDAQTAQLAWRAVRGAALESAHLWVARHGDLERANKSLARLTSNRATNGDARAAYGRALEQLSHDRRPRGTPLVLLAVGLVLAAAGLILVGAQGLASDGRLSLLDARWGVILAIIGAACWTVAVYQA